MKAFQVQTGRAKAVTKPSLSLLPMQISQTPGGQKQKGREFRNSPRVKSELCFGHRCKLTFLIDKLQACMVHNVFQLRKSHFV